MTDTNPEKINEILTRGVEEIFIKDHLEKQLQSGKQLRIKLGIDPTGPKIHIGRAVTLRKLKAFQDLGHQIVLIIGDFTAQIGDASDKDSKRPKLSREEVLLNFKDYERQIGKILDMSKVELHTNSEWLDELGFEGAFKLAEHFSLQQMLRRRNFSDRIEKGNEIGLHEILYPLMQGYDSVAIKADVEIGGFDQLFNLQAGRTLQKAYNQPEQDIMNLQMLEGTDGRKMSTSWGNIITIIDEPDDMFGKIMALKDELLEKYFLLCTDISENEIKRMVSNIQNGDNPMQYKKQLAREIVTLYHSADQAIDAQNNWEQTFSEGGIPENISEINGESGKLLSEVLVEHDFIGSKAEFRRLTDEGGVKIITETDEIKITDFQYKLSETIIVKVGKKKFVKIIVN